MEMSPLLVKDCKKNLHLWKAPSAFEQGEVFTVPDITIDINLNLIHSIIITIINYCYYLMRLRVS